MDWMRKVLGHKFEDPISMATSVVGSVAASVIGSMLSDDEDEPEPQKAPLMPDADDEAARMARKRAIYQRLSKDQGRASTIMSDSAGDTLG